MWRIFQSTYDRIDGFDFDVETKARLQSLANALPSKIAKVLTDKVLWLCTTAMTTFGKKWVESIFQQIIDFLKETLEGLKKRD